VYNHYGAAMHFYVRSMITDLFLIMTRYRNARVQPWPAVRLGSKRANSNDFDPNIELEFRNQAAAMTDCLLLYKIPIRHPYPERHDVVACFSPLFLNERWQLLLLTAEVYNHYGAAMHFYVRSMITDLFLIMTRYRNARVQPWPAVRLGSKRANSNDFDPNIELEFRNQAAAMTDCLLLYKIFLMYPEAAVIAYNMTQSGIIS
ncbi:hypothetical protein TELCIR_20398, partial [Teladorsagia circumcincta]